MLNTTATVGGSRLLPDEKTEKLGRMPNFSLLDVPFYSSPLLESALATKQLTPKELEMVRFYREHGYLHITEPIVDELFAKQIDQDVQVSIDNVNKRLQDGWRTSAAIRELASNEIVFSLLRTLYGRKPIPFQRLCVCNNNCVV